MSIRSLGHALRHGLTGITRPKGGSLVRILIHMATRPIRGRKTTSVVAAKKLMFIAAQHIHSRTPMPDELADYIVDCLFSAAAAPDAHGVLKAFHVKPAAGVSIDPWDQEIQELRIYKASLICLRKDPDEGRMKEKLATHFGLDISRIEQVLRRWRAIDEATGGTFSRDP